MVKKPVGKVNFKPSLVSWAEWLFAFATSLSGSLTLNSAFGFPGKPDLAGPALAVASPEDSAVPSAVLHGAVHHLAGTLAAPRHQISTSASRSRQQTSFLSN